MLKPALDEMSGYGLNQRNSKVLEQHTKPSIKRGKTPVVGLTSPTKTSLRTGSHLYDRLGAPTPADQGFATPVVEGTSDLFYSSRGFDLDCTAALWSTKFFALIGPGYDGPWADNMAASTNPSRWYLARLCHLSAACVLCARLTAWQHARTPAHGSLQEGFRVNSNQSTGCFDVLLLAVTGTGTTNFGYNRASQPSPRPYPIRKKGTLLLQETRQ